MAKQPPGAAAGPTAQHARRRLRHTARQPAAEVPLQTEGPRCKAGEWRYTLLKRRRQRNSAAPTYGARH